MNKIYFVASLLFIGGTSAYSANEIKVNKLLKTNGFIVNEPLRIDSVNLQKNKFEDKNLLNYSFLPKADAFTEAYADSTGFFSSEKVEDKSSFSFYKFYIRSDRYSKATVEIKSPDMLQLFVNGKKVTEKTSVEDSLSVAGKASSEITFEPGQKEITVKYLSLAKSKCKPSLKIDVIPAKNDSLAVFETSVSDKHPLTIEYQMTGKRLSGVSISPDGKYAYINYTTVLPDGNKVYSKPLVRLSDNTEIYELSNKDNLMWMPVSSTLSFTRKGMNGKELVSLNPETMSETVIVDNLPEGYFYWGPNEKFLCFTTSEELPGANKDVHNIITPNDRQPGWRNRYNIAKYDIETGMLQQITYGYHNVHIYDFSNDCKKAIFSESYENLTERPFSLTSVYELDLENYTVDTLWYKQKFINNVSYSPDNSKLLVTGTGESFDGIGNNIKEGQISNLYDTQAFIYDRKDKTIDPITKDFNPAIDRANWFKGDNKIYFTCTDKDYENVYSYDVKSKKFEKLPLNVDVISNFSLADNAPVAVYYGQSVSYPEQAFSYQLKSKKSTLLSDPQKDQFEKYELGEVKDWSFVSTDGTTIEGRYYLPVNFDPNKKYPMIVYYYGGTSTTPRTFFHPYSMHLYAAQGYVVYILQPSGTTGYGQEFSARHVNAWGIQTADDIICGVKQFCKEHSFVNEKKIGCMGASYGGFMTMYLQTRTDIFAAAVSHAGISALSSYWGEGYWGYSYSAAASAGSYPWNNQKMYVEQSPLFNADKVNTPILLLHGTADTNVPTGESIQMFTALKLLGKQVDFVLVNGENHGISEFNKRLAWKKSIFAFFAKWLKDEPEWWEAQYPKSVVE